MFLSDLTLSEKKRFLFVTLAFMCVTAAALVARTTADTLFLTRFGHQHLAYMYLGTALVVSSVAFVYGSLIGRLPIIRLICLSIGFLVTMLIILRVGLLSSWDGVRIAAYFIGDLTVHIPIMLFWTFAVFLFDPRQAKRLFGFIGAGGTLGCILIGFVVKPTAQQFGTPALIILIIALLISFILLVIHISKTESHRFPPPGGKTKTRSQLQQYIQHFKTPQIQHLIAIVFVANIALSLIDYQFKAGARAHYTTAELAGFFGNFYALTSIIALFIQLFLVHHILQKGGMKLGLSLLPLGILIGCTGVLFTAQYAWILVTKVMVQIFLFTIDIAALQMLFMSIPTASRNQARAFADGIIKPIAIATTGVALVATVHHLPLHYLALGGIVLSICWLILAHTNSKAYITALIQSLDTKRFDHSSETVSMQDHTVVAYIREALQTAPDTDIPYLLSLADEIAEQDWTSDYRKLLDKEAAEIKIKSIRHLAKHGEPADINILEGLLQHPNTSVRAETIRALSTLGNVNTINMVEPFLEDATPTVQAAAISGLVNHGDLDQLIDAGIKFRDLLQSNSATHKVAAAQALADITDSTLNRSLVNLLQDPDKKVKTAALETCRVQQDLQLIPVLIALLSDPDVGTLTSDVLSNFGAKATNNLLQNLKTKDGAPLQPGVLEIPAVLSEIGDTKALPALLKASESSNRHFSAKSIHAFARLQKHTGVSKDTVATTYALIKKEMDQAKHRQMQIHDMAHKPGTELLKDALNDMCMNHLKNAFVLIDAILPQVEIMGIFETLINTESPSNNALEVLDNLLPKAIKNDVIDFFEAPKTKNDETPEFLKLERMLEVENDIWVICGALMATVENKTHIAYQALQPHLSHPHQAVRETSLYTLHKQNEPQHLKSACLSLKEDPDVTVRRLALAYLTELQNTSNANN